MGRLWGKKGQTTMKRFTTGILVLGVSMTVSGCLHFHESTGSSDKYEAPTPEDKALAERAKQTEIMTIPTPAREVAHRITAKGENNHWKMLRGDMKALPGQLADARQGIAQQIETAKKGLTWPEPPLCRVPYTATPPKIDGKLDDPAWAGAAAYSGVYLFNEKNKLNEPATTLRVTWDNDRLYFAFDCKDRDLLAPQMKRDEDIYSWDCVEVYLLPAQRTKTYWEIDISPSGCVYDAIVHKYPDKWGLLGDPYENVEGLEIGIDVRGTINNSDDTDDGYTVEVAVPFSELATFRDPTKQSCVVKSTHHCCAKDMARIFTAHLV